jgi:hypothetical protein
VGGPLHVMDLHNVSPRSLAFVEAGVELGWLRNDDCNGACQEPTSGADRTFCAEEKKVCAQVP